MVAGAVLQMDARRGVASSQLKAVTMVAPTGPELSNARSRGAGSEFWRVGLLDEEMHLLDGLLARAC